ncbi:hypothetical protein NDU88_001505 [Pleurodeles waltl]|uniref:Uncharacterized protein n=1 Tax=Pleurodeles waltl TaxID=8319 RepID=A0AAV7T0G4_PLEWA|nr:hypothetical protein NDU88_001505 [Pleurodeles waltl]
MLRSEWCNSHVTSHGQAPSKCPGEILNGLGAARNYWNKFDTEEIRKSRQASDAARTCRGPIFIPVGLSEALEYPLGLPGPAPNAPPCLWPFRGRVLSRHRCRPVRLRVICVCPVTATIRSPHDREGLPGTSMGEGAAPADGIWSEKAGVPHCMGSKVGASKEGKRKNSARRVNLIHPA